MATGTWQKKMVLLWTNNAPTNSFPAQTVPLDLSGYDLVLISIRMANTVTYGEYSQAVVGGGEVNFSMVGDLSASNVPYIRQRHYTPTNTGIVFGDGRQKAATGTTSGNTDNNMAIPYKIWGIIAYTISQRHEKHGNRNVGN